jgi:UDP-N-acetylglucosamine 3-dehydrogenase
MRKLRVGLIGLGGVAEVHLAGYKEVNQIEVVAGAEIQKDRLNNMVKKWGIKGYTNYEEMLDKAKLDIACVLTPPRYHREVTEKAAEYGINVLCEKPMAVTLDDAKAMIAKCEKEGVKFCYGSSYRFLPACRKAKEMIDGGLLGDVSILMEVFIGGQGPKNWHDLGPDHYPLGGPGGGGMGLVDHGIHLVDTFRWLIQSEVESVMGRGNYSGQPPNTELLTMIFKNGAVGQLVYNEATYPSDMPYEGIFSWGGGWDISGNLISGGGWNAQPGSIRVHGEKGALRIFYYANKLFLFGNGKQEQIRVMDRPMPSNFALQMESFSTRLQRGDDPEVAGVDGLKALQIILAAYESFESQKIVQIKSII